MLKYWLLFALLLSGYAFTTSHINFRSSLQHRSPLSHNPRNILRSHPEDLKSFVAQSQDHGVTKKRFKCLPCGDDVDRRIFQIALPAMMNYAIVPFVHTVNTFWVGRMGNALALAGQGAASQIFTSYFWFFSFIPSVITPLIAKAHGAKDTDSIRERIGEAVFIAGIMGIIGTIMLGIFPSYALSLVLKEKAPAREFAVPYLRMRGMTFLPALLSTIGFAVFRGSQDVVTPLKISILSNVLNVLLDPFLMFSLGLGLSGAAAASCLSELISFAFYTRELRKKDYLRTSTLLRWPSLAALLPLLANGLSIQLKAVAVNTALLAVTRATQRLDHTGTAAAAHSIALQLFTLGSIPSLAMSTVSSIMIPAELARADAEGRDRKNVRLVANRLLAWGLLIGCLLAVLQLLALPLIRHFTPLPDVQAAAVMPSAIGALLQLLNCFAWTGEGIQQGTGSFFSIALATTSGTLAMLVSLRLAGDSLPRIWLSFVLLAAMRIVGVLRHHLYSGPFAKQRESVKQDSS